MMNELSDWSAEPDAQSAELDDLRLAYAQLQAEHAQLRTDLDGCREREALARSIADVAAFARSVVNAALEDVAVRLEAVEHAEMNRAAELVRAMREE